MGGTDVRGVTGEMLDLLARTGRALSVTAITQPAGHAALASRVAELDLDVELVAPQADLTDLMLGQDLVVSAAGTSVWELCCLGVPAALVCVSDNQQAGYRRVLDQGAAVGLGSAESGLDQDAAVQTLRSVLDDVGLRDALSRTATRLVDGRGAWRVVRAWEQLAGRAPNLRPVATGVRVRPADGRRRREAAPLAERPDHPGGLPQLRRGRCRRAPGLAGAHPGRPGPTAAGGDRRRRRRRHRALGPAGRR